MLHRESLADPGLRAAGQDQDPFTALRFNQTAPRALEASLGQTHQRIISKTRGIRKYFFG
jgi:hypothetical protein